MRSFMVALAWVVSVVGCSDATTSAHPHSRDAGPACIGSEWGCIKGGAAGASDDDADGGCSPGDDC